MKSVPPEGKIFSIVSTPEAGKGLVPAETSRHRSLLVRGAGLAGIAVIVLGVILTTRTVLAAPPTAPQNVAASSGVNQATVSWQAPSSNGGSAITAYKVVAFAGTVARNATYVSASATTLTMSGLAGSTSYTFSVYAVNASGTSPPGTSASVAPTGTASTYASTVIGDGPSLYYRFDDSAGVGSNLGADSSGNGRDGTYSGSLQQGKSGALANDPSMSTPPTPYS